jgi:hypothetical protein
MLHLSYSCNLQQSNRLSKELEDRRRCDVEVRLANPILIFGTRTYYRQTHCRQGMNTFKTWEEPGAITRALLENELKPKFY